MMLMREVFDIRVKRLQTGHRHLFFFVSSNQSRLRERSCPGFNIQRTKTMGMRQKKLCLLPRLEVANDMNGGRYRDILRALNLSALRH